MKLPKKVRIGPYTFRVLVLDAAEMGDSVGEFCLQSQVIKIRAKMGDCCTIETLLHEILHGVFAICAFDEIDHEAEERIIKRVSPILCSVIRDNPDLVAEWPN